MSTNVLSARERAEKILGVAPNAAADSIRAIWKKRAFELHPDRGNASTDEFLAVQDAYIYLSTLAQAAKTVSPKRPEKPASDATEEPVKPARPGARPAAEERVTLVSPEERAECEALLDGASDGHVPEYTRRTGRRISYIVKSPAREGENIVAVPTGVLIDSRKVFPTLIRIAMNRASGKVADLPEEVRQEHFPGARSVRIHFESAA